MPSKVNNYNPVLLNNSEFKALFELKAEANAGALFYGFHPGDQIILECPAKFIVKSSSNNDTVPVTKSNHFRNIKDGVLESLLSLQPTIFYTASTNFEQPIQIINNFINVENVNVNCNHGSNDKDLTEDARQVIHHHSAQEMVNVANNNYNFSLNDNFASVVHHLKPNNVEKRLASLFETPTEEDSTPQPEVARRVLCFHPITQDLQPKIPRKHDKWIERLMHRVKKSEENKGSDKEVVLRFHPLVNQSHQSSVFKPTKNWVNKVFHKDAKTEEKRKTPKHAKKWGLKRRFSKSQCTKTTSDTGSSVDSQAEEGVQVSLVPTRQNRADMLFGPQQDARFETQNYEEDEEDE